MESGLYPLLIRIKKQQLKFWKGLQRLMTDNPNHHISNLVRNAENFNLNYIRYYKNLESSYIFPKNCESVLRRNFREDIERKITSTAAADDYSKLGAYFEVNPQFIAPNFRNVFELDRIVISRYRSGSHNLKIESGRFCTPKIEREYRTCTCTFIRI